MSSFRALALALASAPAYEPPPGARERVREDLARAGVPRAPLDAVPTLRAVAPKIAAIVRAVLGRSHPDVDDATQEALVGFVRALPAFRGDCDPLGYARVIAVRTAILARRRAKSRSSGADAEVDVDDVASSAPSPGAESAATHRRDVLRALLAELPEEQAEALAMRVVLGCSLPEIARETGVPLNTVRSRIRLAKERLRARIEADESLLAGLDAG